MRRFSSEGSLLDLDLLPWRRVALSAADYEPKRGAGVYASRSEANDPEADPAELLPVIQEPEQRVGELIKEHSVSAENLKDLVGKAEQDHLAVCAIGEGYKAYSDSQLAPAAQGGADGAEKDGPASPTAASGPAVSKFEHRHRQKLAAAKLHLKSLFGQSPHSSTSNLSAADHQDSVSKRRSRLRFMRQWSQVGMNRRSRISREELESWAESLNALLDSHAGVTVFGAFLRSEFSEENLQFYRACEQYRQSSNNFNLQRRAKDICNTYILPGSPREVNLDSKTRELTLQLLQAPSHASLSHAQKRIYSLLDTDCYPRFLQSNIYLALLQDAD